VDIRETAVVFMITARYTVRPFGQWRIPLSDPRQASVG